MDLPQGLGHIVLYTCSDLIRVPQITCIVV